MNFGMSRAKERTFLGATAVTEARRSVHTTAKEVEKDMFNPNAINFRSMSRTLKRSSIMHKQEGEIQQSLPITDHTYVMKATYGKDETNSVVSIQSANA